MGNVKISELPYASRIDDDALVVLVQDHANKVVTVDELSQKINEKQNHTIDHLWHELRRATGMETVKALSNTASNHEYRIDNIEKFIEKKNKQQDCQLTNLTNSLREIAARQHSHHDDINILQTGVKENRRSLAYLNFRVDGVIKDTYTYFNNISQIQADLAAAIQKHEADLSYTYDYIERAAEATKTYCNTYTSTEVDNNWTYTYSAYAYITDFVHFSPNEYWGGIKENKDMYNGFQDNFLGTTKTENKDDTTNPGTTTNKGCSEGCTC